MEVTIFEDGKNIGTVRIQPTSPVGTLFGGHVTSVTIRYDNGPPAEVTYRRGKV